VRRAVLARQIAQRLRPATPESGAAISTVRRSRSREFRCRERQLGADENLTRPSKEFGGGSPTSRCPEPAVWGHDQQKMTVVAEHVRVSIRS
jgi:hypothetical protein